MLNGPRINKELEPDLYVEQQTLDQVRGRIADPRLCFPQHGVLCCGNVCSISLTWLTSTATENLDEATQV